MLHIKNLSVSFRQENRILEAVKNVSFETGTGEILAIAGESGSGKSLTALSITGLLPAHATRSGSIILNDPRSGPVELSNAANLREIRGSRISMIFQEPMTSLNPLMRCGLQVEEAIKRKKNGSGRTSKQEAMEALSMAGFALPQKIYNRYPHQLSGGQKQRVMIAMAIVCRPLLLIADEPTTALDVRIQKEILDTLTNLRNLPGMSVIIISHDLGIIADVADRVIIMNKGEIVEEGLTQNVLQHPRHPYTKALLECRVAGYPKGVRLPAMKELMEHALIENMISPSLPPATPSALLSVENLSVIMKSGQENIRVPFKAVDDVTFNLNRNEITGLVGESGCGKTTLGRTLLGLIKPDKGRVLLNGSDINVQKGSSRLSLHRELQIVFQDPYGSLNPRIPVGDAIMEVLKVHRKGNDRSNREKVAELLEKVNLDAGHFNRYPHEFSGGQRQRICLARALATEPSFLVFDEALSALDVSIQAQILNLINDLKNEFGFSALFISHDLALVHYISDRILVMRSGKIIEQGTAEELFRNPKENYTRLLLDSIPGKNLPHPRLRD